MLMLLYRKLLRRNACIGSAKGGRSMSKEEQKPNIYQIPKNSFDTGYVLNGQFKPRNFVEGIILALPFLGIFIYGWHDLGWDVQSTVAYCAILCAAPFPWCSPMVLAAIACLSLFTCYPFPAKSQNLEIQSSYQTRT